MDIEIGGDTFTKKPSILEEIAYRDTWGKGTDSFIVTVYERLGLMRDLLHEEGSIYVHQDPCTRPVRCFTRGRFWNRASIRELSGWSAYRPNLGNDGSSRPVSPGGAEHPGG
jgi:hypothetical protein